MKKIALCLLLTIFSLNVKAQEIVLLNEFSSYEDALIISKEQNKEILLVFTGEYCSFCDKQKEVILDKDVIKFLKNKVICFVDILENKTIAKKYNVKVVPTYFLLNYKGSIVKKNVGYKNKNEFISWLK